MSLVKDLKASVNQSFLDTRDSDEILLDLKSELSNHNNLALILEELTSYTYRGKKQRVTRMIFERVSNGDNIEDVFLVYGLIEQEEYILLKRALSTLAGVEAIVSFRKEGSQFINFLRKIFMPLGLFVFFGLLSFVFTSPMLKNFLDTEVAPLVAAKKNYTVKFDLPVFIENEFYVYLVIFIYIGILSALFFTYVYFRKNNIGKLYRISNLLFYDDFIKYFTIASTMKKGSASSDQIFEDLSYQAVEGLQSTFNDMFIKGSDYYESLEILYAPYRITSQLRRNEENSKFWTNLDSTIEYVKGLRNDKVDFYVKYFSRLTYMFGLVFMLGCLAIPLIYFILNIYAFAM